MGMPFTRPNPVQAHRITDLDWQDNRHHDRVCISIDTGSLARLMQNRQLHAEDFSCLDASSQSLVRNLLLACLRHS